MKHRRANSQVHTYSFKLVDPSRGGTGGPNPLNGKDRGFKQFAPPFVLSRRKDVFQLDSIVKLNALRTHRGECQARYFTDSAALILRQLQKFGNVRTLQSDDPLSLQFQLLKSFELRGIQDFCQPCIRGDQCSLNEFPNFGAP